MTWLEYAAGQAEKGYWAYENVPGEDDGTAIWFSLVAQFLAHQRTFENPVCLGRQNVRVQYEDLRKLADVTKGWRRIIAMDGFDHGGYGQGISGIYVCDHGVQGISLRRPMVEYGRRTIVVHWQGATLERPPVGPSATEIARMLRGLRGDLEDVKSVQARVGAVAKTPHGIEFVDLGPVHCPLVRQNYTPPQLAQFDRVVAEFSRSSPKARFVLLEGLQGTGKTYYLQGLVTEIPQCKSIVIPASMIEELAGPSLLPVLLEARQEDARQSCFASEEEGGGIPAPKPYLLLVEDADFCLIPRGSDNMSALSALLNLTDGIVGRALDVRVIVTTNAPVKEIDQALLRPGRLLERVSFDRLTPEHGAAVFRRLSGSELSPGFDPRVTLAAIYKAAGRG